MSERNANREELGHDGTVRKKHYGPGRQLWDDIKDEGWDVHFSAGCILRYLRRDKDIEHSLESAQWYLRRLQEMTALDYQDSRYVFNRLVYGILTAEERNKLII